MSAFLKKQKPDWLALDRLIMMMFIFGASAFRGSNQQRSVGIAMIFIFFTTYYAKKENRKWPLTEVPPELKLWGTWFIWTFLTGIFVASIKWHFFQEIWQLVQMSALIYVFYGLLRIKPSLHHVFFAIILTGLYQGGSAVFGLTQLVDEAMVGGLELEDVRLQGSGNTQNSNALATLMVSGLFSCFYLWRSDRPLRKLSRLLLLAFMVFAAYVVVFSGSRKATLYYAYFLTAWFVWILPNTKALSGVFSRLFFSGLAAFFLLILAPNLLEGTAAGKRWGQFFDRGNGSLMGALEGDIRIWMYREGIQMLRQNPIAGVGLGHYRVYHSLGNVSHSDFTESLANTGIVGFLLYQSIKIVLLRRCLKMYRWSRTPLEQYRAKLFLVICGYFFIYSFGFYIYRSQPLMILLTSLATATWLWEKDMKLRRDYSSQHAGLGQHRNFAASLPNTN